MNYTRRCLEGLGNAVKLVPFGYRVDNREDDVKPPPHRNVMLVASTEGATIANGAGCRRRVR